MISVSNQYKDIMSRPKRNRAFISVGIGIIDQNAQASGTANGAFAYWSKGNIFDTNKKNIEYATLEENYMKADGSMLFLPENNELIQLNTNGITTDSVMGPIRIDFPEMFDIKGLTIEFGSAYPTELELETRTQSLRFNNDSIHFSTSDMLGDTDYIIIRPISMVGGQQRFRVKNVLMGIGLSYMNEQTKSFSHKDFCSSISEELPREETSFTFFDEENRFNVDVDDSFMAYLEEMQKVTISFGVELDDSSIEWHQIATNYLKNWKIQNGTVTLNATDRLAQMKDYYNVGYKIHERTAYEEAESIFIDAGLEPHEYYIDDYLKDVILTNPMPQEQHKDCLKILANACRCILKQDENGRIVIKPNFANVIDQEEVIVSTNGHTKWSKPSNIIIGRDTVYADLTKNFMKADGKMYFMPEDGKYLETAYVSDQIAGYDGYFINNPTITLQLPAAYTYYGVNIDFGGNKPAEMIIHTFNNDELVESVSFLEIKDKNFFLHEFVSFDKMVIEFTKGYPQNRVLVNKVGFGDLSDYTLTKLDWMKFPVGYRENRTKSVRVRVFKFENNEENEPIMEETEKYVEKVIGTVGIVKTLQNPLVSTEEHAELLAKWLGNYYANNVYYSVKYRGEPRVSSADIIHAYSDVKENMQVEVMQNEITFNGAFGGSMEYRRALRMMKEV